MTTPKVNTISRSGSRFYVHPESGAKAPGVTSVIGMLPKGFLGPWNAKVVAQEAVDNLGAVVGLALNGDRGKSAAVEMLKGAARRTTSVAAEIGTNVHDLFERIAKGERIGRVHPDYQPFINHFHEFLDQFQPEFVFLEETVWSEAHDYAGSFDALMTIQGETVFGDWKTTRSGVHPEVALQLAAYRHADYILRPDGSRVPMPATHGGAVLHVRPEGWKLVPAACGDKEFGYFLHLREVFRWDSEHKTTVIGDPLNIAAASARRRTTRPQTGVA